MKAVFPSSWRRSVNDVQRVYGPLPTVARKAVTVNLRVFFKLHVRTWNSTCTRRHGWRANVEFHVRTWSSTCERETTSERWNKKSLWSTFARGVQRSQVKLHVPTCSFTYERGVWRSHLQFYERTSINSTCALRHGCFKKKLAEWPLRATVVTSFNLFSSDLINNPQSSWSIAWMGDSSCGAWCGVSRGFFHRILQKF